MKYGFRGIWRKGREKSFWKKIRCTEKEGKWYLPGWLFQDDGEKVVRAKVSWESLGSSGEIERVLELARMDEEGNLTSFSVSWSRPAVTREDGYLSDSSLITISLFPYRDSTNYQAERKVWSFGYDHGLSKEGVPALSTQEEKRDWCRKIIEGMEFETLGEQVEELSFSEIFP